MTERSEGIGDTVLPVTLPTKEGTMTERSEGIGDTVRLVTAPTKEGA
jgi:hypothetical protein